MNINEAILRFLEYCELDRNLSLKTVKMYGYYLNFFKKWLLKSSQYKVLSIKQDQETDNKDFPV